MQTTSNGAFKIGNGTATWVNRPTNTTGEVRSVFNGTNAVEPTAIPSTPKEQDTGMSAAGIAGLAVLGGLGLVALVTTAKIVYNRCKSSGIYLLGETPADKHYPDDPEGQRQPLNLGNNIRENTHMEGDEPKATDSLLTPNGNQGQTAPKKPEVQESRPRSLSQGNGPLHPKPLRAEGSDILLGTTQEGLCPNNTGLSWPRLTESSNSPRQQLETVVLNGKENRISWPN